MSLLFQIPNFINLHWKTKKLDLNDLYGTINDFDLGFLFGRFSSDGTYMGSRFNPRGLAWYVSYKETELIELFQRWLSIYDPTLVDHPNNSCKSLEIFSIILGDQANKAKLKTQIPDTFRDNIFLKRGWASGMFDGDGTISKQRNGYNITFTNICETLTDDLSNILTELKISHRKFITKAISPRKDRHRIYVHKGSHFDFNSLVGFRAQHKAIRMHEALRS